MWGYAAGVHDHFTATAGDYSALKAAPPPEMVMVVAASPQPPLGGRGGCGRRRSVLSDSDIQRPQVTGLQQQRPQMLDINSSVGGGGSSSGLYGGIEYIDSDCLVQRNGGNGSVGGGGKGGTAASAGWTHHKVSSGQLSLHIVSQV